MKSARSGLRVPSTRRRRLFDVRRDQRVRHDADPAPSSTSSRTMSVVAAHTWTSARRHSADVVREPALDQGIALVVVDHRHARRLAGSKPPRKKRRPDQHQLLPEGASPRCVHRSRACGTRRCSRACSRAVSACRSSLRREDDAHRRARVLRRIVNAAEANARKPGRGRCARVADFARIVRQLVDDALRAALVVASSCSRRPGRVSSMRFLTRSKSVVPSGLEGRHSADRRPRAAEPPRRRGDSAELPRRREKTFSLLRSRSFSLTARSA